MSFSKYLNPGADTQKRAHATTVTMILEGTNMEAFRMMEAAANIEAIGNIALCCKYGCRRKGSIQVHQNFMFYYFVGEVGAHRKIIPPSSHRRSTNNSLEDEEQQKHRNRVQLITMTELNPEYYTDVRFAEEAVILNITETRAGFDGWCLVGSGALRLDLPRNATLITGVLGTWIYARECAHRGEKVTSVMVVEVVRRLMGLEEKCRVRQKAAELGIMVRRSAEEGGIMCKELYAFIAQITRK